MQNAKSGGRHARRGPDRWPVNFAHGADGHARAWAMILGLERGWLRRDRSGYAEWTGTGRAAHARLEAPPAVPAPMPARHPLAPPRLDGRQLDLFENREDQG